MPFKLKSHIVMQFFHLRSRNQWFTGQLSFFLDEIVGLLQTRGSILSKLFVCLSEHESMNVQNGTLLSYQRTQEQVVLLFPCKVPLFFFAH